MDVSLMQFVAEAQPAAPPKAPGKAAAANTKDSDGGSFGAMFAELVTPGKPTDGEGAKQTADTASDAKTAADTTTTGMIPGMLSFVPMAAMVPLVPMAATAPQTDQGAATAITPLTATATGQATPAQPPAQPTVDTQGLQQAIAEALTQQTGQQQPAQAAPAQPPQMPLTQAATAQTAKPGDVKPTVIMPETMPVTVPTVQAPAQQVLKAETTQAAPKAQATQTTQETQITQTTQAAPDVPLAAPAPTATTVPAAEAVTTSQTGQQQTAAPAIMAAATDGRQRQPEKPAPATASQGEPETVTPGEKGPQAAAAAVTPQADTQGAGDEGNALTAETFAPKGQDSAPAAETATNQPFAVYVDQATARQQSGDASPVAASGQPEASQDPHNVAGQIVNHARLISRAENSEMVIRLNPEHLGELTLKIAVDSGVVSATFHTSNAEVRAAIEASLPQLRQDMANQGLKVDNVGVYASLDHFFANDQRHAPQQQQQLTVRRPNGDEAFSETAATVTALGAQTVTGGTGIDYRI